MFGRKVLRCSFCGKDETQVSKLVAGPNVFICDVCTAAAARLMDAHGDGSPPPAPESPKWRAVLRRVWRLVHEQLFHRLVDRASEAP